MKDFVYLILRQSVSPSLRFALREWTARLSQLAGRLCIWRWEIVRFAAQTTPSNTVIYAGRKESRKLAASLRRMPADGVLSSFSDGFLPHFILISELPVPHALCVPQYLSTVIPTGVPLESITNGYGSELKNLLRKQRGSYTAVKTTEPQEVDRIENTMLRPYTVARHDNEAVQLTTTTVRKFSQPEFGRLDTVFLHGEAVACHLGCAFAHRNKRYWHSLRFGYPESVFADRKRYSDINSMNTYMALEWAVQNGFDYYDMGISKAIPDGGLIQWKKRRKGKLDALGNHGCFYLRLPDVGAPDFLYTSPVFSLEGNEICLHLGLPATLDSDTIKARYREMGFGGLSRLYLHCVREPSQASLTLFRNLYLQQDRPTDVKTVLHPS